MKLPPWTIAALLLAFVSRVGAVERLPIENFSKTPEISQALLSPDGNQVAYLADHNGVTKLHIIDLGGKPPIRINLGQETIRGDTGRRWQRTFGRGIGAWCSQPRRTVSSTACWR